MSSVIPPVAAGHRSDPLDRPAAWVVPLEDVGLDDVAVVGGKCAGLGELLGRLGRLGVPVPGGVAVTAAAYRAVLALNGLDVLVEALDAAAPAERPAVASRLRDGLLSAALPERLAADLRRAYADLGPDAAVAVRSSATAEDLPSASFAGQHDSFLGVEGAEEVLVAYRACLASLFTDRAVAYRDEHGFEHRRVALAVAVQLMVRSDLGASGVIFTVDPDTGFDGVVVVDGVWGLGETLVGGSVEPDRWRVLAASLDRPGARPVLPVRLGSKHRRAVRGAGGLPAVVPNPPEMAGSPVLSTAQVLRLARWALAVAAEHGRPMDLEWALDGLTGDLWIVQARPETVQSRADRMVLRTVSVRDRGPVLARGRAVGTDAAVGRVRVVDRPTDHVDLADREVLVARSTDPDWVPLMRRAAAVVTDEGGGTSHAAIVSRELGLPAVLGCGTATSDLHDGTEVTVVCADGPDGVVLRGAATVDRRTTRLEGLPSTRTKVMLNVADPDAALRWWALPAAGFGLVRMEFLVAERLGVHPMALVHPADVADPAELVAIDALVGGRGHGPDWFVEHLAAGLAELAAVAAPGPALVRLSDFKTDEYARLLGGAAFEPPEANPMLGWRGASRYADPGYREGFALECRAVRRARGELGQQNISVMVPFCRTPEEADAVLAVMADEGLARGDDGLEVWVMAEVPSNIVRAEEFSERFDGFSVGSNDLTQLTLGVDRNSARLAARFGPDDPAVLGLVADLVRRAHAQGRPVGFCGQAPSNDPAYAARLVDMGIDSVSVAPDSFVEVVRHVAQAEGRPA